jgi:hypothetical protein
LPQAARLDHKDPQVRPARWDYPAQREQPARLEHKDPLARLERQEHQGRRGRKG